MCTSRHQFLKKKGVKVFNLLVGYNAFYFLAFVNSLVRFQT